MTRPIIQAFVLTGFLGAGKTTLLNRLLKLPSLADTAVVINEYGEAGLDHFLVEKSGDGVVLLSSGCLCCSLRGDLLDTLADLAARREAGTLPRFSRVVIETTGLAHPTPVLQTLLSPQLAAAGYSLAGVIAVADATGGESLLDAHPESLAQMAVADRILVSKAELAADAPSFMARLARLNPGAKIEAMADVDLSALLQPADIVPRGVATTRRPFFSAHDPSIISLLLTTRKVIEPWRLAGFLDELRERHGEGLLRIKALVKLSDDPGRPMLVHGVQHLMHPPLRLSDWPDQDALTRIVLITRGQDARAIEALFAAVIGDVSPDMPDWAAMTDNPLAL